MPGGLGGRGRRGVCRRQRVMQFLQPSLLLMLTRGEAHGYSLLDGLEEFSFNMDRPDPSLIFHALREMEEGN